MSSFGLAGHDQGTGDWEFENPSFNGQVTSHFSAYLFSPSYHLLSEILPIVVVRVGMRWSKKKEMPNGRVSITSFWYISTRKCQAINIFIQNEYKWILKTISIMGVHFEWLHDQTYWINNKIKSAQTVIAMPGCLEGLLMLSFLMPCCFYSLNDRWTK